MTGPLYDSLAKTLATIRKDYGADVLSNRRRLNGLLIDRMPDNKREIRVLLDAVDDGALTTFETTSADQTGMQIDRLAAVMESQRGTRLDLAQQVIAACAYAVGQGKLPSQLYGTGPQQPSPAPDDDWVGVSEPVKPPPQGNTGDTKDSASVMDWLQDNKPIVAGAAAAIALLFTGLQVILPGDGGTGPSDDSGGGNVQVSFPQYDDSLGYYGELADFEVAERSTLSPALEGLVPLTLPGGDVITTQQLMDQGINGQDFALVDSWSAPHPRGLPYAYNMPNAGQPGTFSDQIQADVEATLAEISGGRKDFPFVFYTENVARWDGYNAALRALNAGYLNVFWYRGGYQSYEAAGLETVASRGGE
ncbi:MAG: rhodanese-like domain-containing protein [Pseudomonadota bacterium]